jgi:hypothetical protein
VPPADPVPAWRQWDLADPPESVFCFQYPRRVANDGTVSWAGRTLAIPRAAGGRAWPGRAVTVEERLDGSLWVAHGGQHLPLAPAPDAPAVLRARRLSRDSEGKPDWPRPISRRPDRHSYPQRPDHRWR